MPLVVLELEITDLTLQSVPPHRLLLLVAGAVAGGLNQDQVITAALAAVEVLFPHLHNLRTMDRVTHLRQVHLRVTMAVADHMDSPMADHPHLLGAVVAEQVQRGRLEQQPLEVMAALEQLQVFQGLL